MFEILLNAIKVASSDDVRKGTVSLLELISRRPEWQHSLCTLEAKVGAEHRELAILLRDIVHSKLLANAYPQEAVGALDLVFDELVSNAFRHGCSPDADTVSLSTHISETYVSITVLNPPLGVLRSRRRRVDLHAVLAAASQVLKANPRSRGGRGLLLCNELADSLQTVADGGGVKAVIYKRRVQISEHRLVGLSVLSADSGLLNPSFKSRLHAAVARHDSVDLIVLFNSALFNRTSSEDYPDIIEGSQPLSDGHMLPSLQTPTWTALIEIDELRTQQGWRTAVVVPAQCRMLVRMPSELLFVSLGDALSSMSRLDLRESIATLTGCD